MKNNPVTEKVHNEYKNNSTYYLAYSALFAAVVVIIFAMAYFLPFSLIFTIPFILVPFGVSFQICVNNVLIGNGYSSAAFFRFYALYFTRPFFGITKSLLGMLKTLGVFFGIYFLIAGPVTSIVVMTNPDYFALLENLTEENMIALSNLMVTDPVLSVVVPLVFGFAFMCAGYMFLHHYFFHSVKVASKFMYKVDIPLLSTVFFNFGFKRIRRMFAKDYYSTIWHIIIIFVSACVIGYVFCYLLVSKQLTSPGVMGLAFGIASVSFGLPYVYLTLFYSLQAHFDEYHEGGKEDFLKDIDEMVAKGQISETNREFLKKSFDMFDKARVDKNPSDINPDDIIDQ